MAWLNNAKWIYQSLWHGPVSLLMTHKNSLGRDSSNSTQATIEHSLVFACICIYFIISGYRKRSRVGTVVPEPGARRGETKTEKKLLWPKSLMWSRERVLTGRWRPHSHTLSCNVKHTCRHWYTCSSSSSILFSFSVCNTHTHTCTVQSRWAKADVGSVSSTGSWFGGVIGLAFPRGDGVRKS